MTSRNWVFTSFKEDFCSINNSSKIKYCIMGKEKCPSTGKDHIQGYVQYKNPVRMTQVKKDFGDDSMHLEVRRGSHEQAKEYCKKDGNFREYPLPVIKEEEPVDMDYAVILGTERFIRLCEVCRKKGKVSNRKINDFLGWCARTG